MLRKTTTKRIDIWDIEKPEEKLAPIDCGHQRGFDDHFSIEQTIGKGGFGLVRVVKEKSTGIEYACKSIAKRLDVPNISAERQAQHLDNIDREIKILVRLRGTLSVVHFKGCWEDDNNVHIVMEWCKGGELHHGIGQRVYTEETVANYMKSVLHTLAQCHSHKILHRDVKPGNFMLLTTEENSPLKALDFGLAVFFDPDNLPMEDLGLEGTAWYMAPEVLSSETYPASDVWSAGVMAYQLLSGYLPFDDDRNPDAPALSIIWQGILTKEPSFNRSAWKEVSNEAKDFVKVLLNKDHTKRPTAKEALKHAWLQSTFHAEKKRPLQSTVVQRIQRYGQTDILRRTILELIANELLKLAPPRLNEGSYRAGTLMPPPSPPSSIPRTSIDEESGDGDVSSTHSGSLFPMSPERAHHHPFSPTIGEHGQGTPPATTSISLAAASPPATWSPFKESAMMGRRSVDSALPPRHAGRHSQQQQGGGQGGGQGQLGTSSSGSLGGSSSLPGAGFRRSPSTKQIALLLKAGAKRGAATVHGQSDYWRVMRQASELAAIGSGHGQMNYLRAVPRSEEERTEQRKAARLSLDTSAHGNSKYLDMMMTSSSIDKQNNNNSGGDGNSDGYSRFDKRKVSPGMRLSRSVGALSDIKERNNDNDNDTTAVAMNVDSMNSSGLNSNNSSNNNDAMPTWPASIQHQDGGDNNNRGGDNNDNSNDSNEDMDVDALERGGRGRSAAWMLMQSNQQEQSGIINSSSDNANTAIVDDGDHIKTVKRVTFDSQQQQPLTTTTTTNTNPTTTAISQSPDVITTPQDLEALMNSLHFKQGKGLTHEALADGLYQLGYELEPTEINVLMDQLDLNKDNNINPSEFVASQLDWGALQRHNRDIWLESARKAFSDLDKNDDGRLTASELIEILKKKLPPEEIDYALEDAMLQAGLVEAEDVDFEGFLKMLRVGSFESLESLDQYEARLRASLLLEGGDLSMHGGRGKLDTVLE